MIRVLVGITASLFLGFIVPAAADSDPVTPDQNDLVAHIDEREPGSVTHLGHGESSLPSCAAAAEGEECQKVVVCLAFETSPLGGRWVLMTQNTNEVFGWCVPDTSEAATPTLTPGRVAEAFRRVPLPPARLVVQPPGGKTLVNFDTIFSTGAQPFERTVRLLGHEVVLRIRPSSFSWHFGDGSEPMRTSEPGRTYQRGLPMDSYITHQYEHASVTVHPRVDTTYSAEYSVDGQPFQPVIGTVTIDGVPATLRVVEARPVLTGTR